MARSVSTKEAYENLANAIIESAVKDYRRALVHARNHPDSEKARRAVQQKEKFFFSHWYEILTDLDPTCLLRGVREMVEKGR